MQPQNNQLIEMERKPTKSMSPIILIDEDFRDIDRCHNDLMVVKIEVANFLVCKVLLDQWKLYRRPLLVGIPTVRHT